MRFVKSIIATVLLALWAPVTMHCTLEAVSSLEVIACSVAGQSQSHQDNDCSEDGCKVVESGHYLSGHREVEVPAPLNLLAVVFIGKEDGLRLPRPFASLPDLPPELTNTWQFSFRAALPARAPSIAS